MPRNSELHSSLVGAVFNLDSNCLGSNFSFPLSCLTLNKLLYSLGLIFSSYKVGRTAVICISQATERMKRVNA